VNIKKTIALSAQFKRTDQLVLLTTSAGLLGFKTILPSMLQVNAVVLMFSTSFSVIYNQATRNEPKKNKLKTSKVL
jgi:hypothetical protein